MPSEIEFTPDFSIDDSDEVNIEELVNNAISFGSSDEWERTKKQQRCIIIDVDGTLADVSGGVQAKEDGTFDWENFFGAMPFYPSNEWCVRLAQIYYQMGFVVHIVTARPDRYKENTEDWLAKYGVPYDFLYMRKDGDMRKDEAIKQEILDGEFPDKSIIEFVVDDRSEVVEMWRKNGITCLQCNQHDFIN